MQWYRNGVWMICLSLIGLGMAACSSGAAPNVGGAPRLVGESTLPPTVPVLTTDQPTANVAAPLNTPDPDVPTATATEADFELISPLQQVTVDAEFVLVTPTLPPSKTPTTTITPTVTITPSQPPTPTIQVTATATAPAFPTTVFIPTSAPVVIPQQVVCDSVWFFSDPQPAGCPQTLPDTSPGVYQSFQNGHMFWVGSLDAIYVLYNNPTFPQWEVFRDDFEESEPHFDPNWPQAPGDELWQPRRGFGKLWRNNQAVRDRIGWAIVEWEEGYSVNVQTDPTGVIYVDSALGEVFALSPQRDNWVLYRGVVGATGPGNVGGAFPTLPGGAGG